MLEEKLREYFKKNKQTVGVNELTKILKLTEEEKKILSKALYELEKEGKLILTEDDNYLPVAEDFYLKHGVVKQSNKGRLYVDLGNGIRIHLSDKFIEKVNEAYENNNITEKTYKKIVSEGQEENISKKRVQENIRRYLKEVLNRKPDIYNGYKSLDLEKVENIISYIASKVKNLTITSLNKYLWYIDMLSFNKRAVAITGLTYQNQKFGPTIVNKKYDELSLLDDKYQREDIETENGNTTKIISNENFNLDKINDSEKEIIDTIIKLLKNKKVTDISEMSHREDGWKKTKRLEKISFEYAMNLKLIK